MPDRRRLIVAGLLSLASIAPWLPAHAKRSSRGNNAQADANAAHGTTPKRRNTVSAGARILVVGDSLSAEYGLPTGSGWVAHIEHRLQSQGTQYQIHNSSISGDTTSGGVSRLPAELDRVQPDIVIIELGSNDALRGQPLDMVRNNLAAMIEQVQQHGARVLLLGMQIPPNYGRRYAEQFAALFPQLAASYNTPLVPFLLEGFATNPEMFLDDGIHPNEAAQTVIADTVWSQLAPMLGLEQPVN